MEMHSLHLLGATGTVRTEVLHGKEYLVVPVVALMEGVIHAVNAETPEFVPLSTLKRAASSWNGRPVVIGHPVKGGKQCSANSPDIIVSHGIGTIYNSRVEGTKLLQEAWIEKSKAKKLNPEMYHNLETKTNPVEVSVGAFVNTDGVSGNHNGKNYKGSWAETAGDHLAFLPGGRGACSVEMGCGTHRAAMRVCGDHMELDVLGGKGSGNFGHSGRKGERGGSGEGDGDSEGTYSAKDLRRGSIALKEDLQNQDLEATGPLRVDLKSGKIAAPVEGGHFISNIHWDDDAEYFEGDIPDSFTKVVGKAGALKGLGGPGSGWTAEGGHVPGSQGGHSDAAKAHRIAADAHRNTSTVPAADALKLTKAAEKATKATGTKPYASEAASAYAKMALPGKSVSDEDRVKRMQEAAKYHESAAKWHDKVGAISAKMSGKVGENAWKLNSKLTQRSNPLNRGGKKITGLEGAEEEELELKNLECPHLHTMKVLFEEVETLHDEAVSFIDDLLDEDEEGNKTDTATLDAVQALSNQMMSTLSNINNLCYKKMFPALPEATSSRYMEELKKALDVLHPTVLAQKPRIRCEGGRWTLYSLDGTKKLSTHNTKVEAENHEEAITKAVAKRKAS